MTKDQRTIKAQAAQIADLTNEVARLKTDLESTRKYKEQYSNELNDLHSTFDLLAVPSRVKGTYNNLSANARLTLYMAMSNGVKVAQPSQED
jgi:phage host-nuclease inhibitor protein Gam